jgi:hypothetical protein
VAMIRALFQSFTNAQNRYMPQRHKDSKYILNILNLCLGVLVVNNII